MGCSITNTINDAVEDVAESGHFENREYDIHEEVEEESPIPTQEHILAEPYTLDSNGLILSMENARLLLDNDKPNGVRFSIEATDDVPEEGILIYVPSFGTTCKQTLRGADGDSTGVSHTTTIPAAGSPADSPAPENPDDTIVLLKPGDKVTLACNVVVGEPERVVPEMTGTLSIYRVDENLEAGKALVEIPFSVGLIGQENNEIDNDDLETLVGGTKEILNLQDLQTNTDE